MSESKIPASQRHTVRTVSEYELGPPCPGVYDEKMQIVVFHWHGPEAEEKCQVVADALNSREWKI
jgi:hypothetical protein